ncbi:MAG: hypothetical protein ACFB0B_18765, partial [Thermonemataceae bacterium]
MKRFSLFLVGYLCVLGSLFAQLPTQPNPLVPQVIPQSPSFSTFQPPSPHLQLRQQQHQEAMQRQQQVLRQHQQAIEEFKAYQRQAEIRKRQEAYAKQMIRYNLGYKASPQATAHYRKAFRILNAMLEGTMPLSLRDAVFAVENAYNNDTLDQAAFNQSIEDIASLLKAYVKKKKYAFTTDFEKNSALVYLMQNGIRAKHPVTKKKTTIVPFRYDFEDYWGREDHTKMFVTKLLRTGSGNCHSMPLLYLLVAEALETKASLAFAPNHSYVMFQDEAGKWLNYEATNQFMASDQLMMGSGFIKAEAIQHGIYMTPLSKKEAVAQCLVDLTLGYEAKFGMDDTIAHFVSPIPKHAPRDIHGH